MALIGLHFSCEKDLKMQSHSTLLQRKCSSVLSVSGPKSDELATKWSSKYDPRRREQEVSEHCYKSPMSADWSEHSFSSDYLRWPSRLGLPNNKVEVN